MYKNQWERGGGGGSNVLFSSLMINYFFPSTHSSIFTSLIFFPAVSGLDYHYRRIKSIKNQCSKYMMCLQASERMSNAVTS